MANVKLGQQVTNKSGPKKKISPEQFEERAQGYFEKCLKGDKDSPPEPPTQSGLAYHVGFSHRGSLWEYQQDEAYKEIVGRAMLFVEYGYEKQVAQGRGDGGIVFILKNFKWTDKQEIEHSEKVVDTGENEW